MSSSNRRFVFDAPALIGLVLRYRILILVVITLLTGIAGYFVTTVRIDNDITKTVPDDVQEKIDFQHLRKLFVSPRTVIFLARFTQPLPLRVKVDSLSSWAQSLSSEGIHGEPIHVGSVQVPVRGGFLGLTTRPIAQSGTDDDEIRRLIAQNRRFTQALVSADESVLCMVLQVDPDADQNAVLPHIIQVAKRIEALPFVQAHITGSPVHTYFIDTAMRKDFALLLPLCVLVVFILLYAVFRKLLYVLSCLGIIVVALIWTFGIMGITGMPFSVTSSVVPVILFPIGVAYSLHVITAFTRCRRERGMGVEEALKTTYGELMDAILLSSITTFVGFGSFGLSRILWTRVFGIFTGIGVLVSLVLTIILLPILLSFERRPAPVTIGGTSQSRGSWSSLAGLYGRLVFDSRVLVCLAMGVLLISLWGFLRVRVEHNYIDMFPRSSSVRKSDDLIADYFGGSRFFSIVLSRSDTTLTTAGFWSEIGEIEELVLAQEGVGGVSSLVPLITGVSSMTGGDRVSDGAVSLLLGSTSLLGKRFGEYIAGYVSADRMSTKLEVTCRNIPGMRYSELARSLRQTIQTRFPGWHVLVAGAAVLNDAMISVIIGTQVSSLILTFAAVLAVVCLLFRSITLGIFAVLPIALSTAFVYALMGFFGVPVNSVTVIIVNTCVGIGIDYSIHFISGFRLNRAIHSDRKQALLATAGTKGPVILFNTFVVGTGFLVLSFSTFPPIRHFGIFVFVSMVVSSGFALLFMPALLRMSGKEASVTQ